MSDMEGAAPPPLVLIVESDEWAARALASILEGGGFAVLWANCGRDASDYALSREPEAVILGDRLPDADGIELCRRLCRESCFQWTPLVLVTAGPLGRAERLRAYHAGAWEILSRPLDGEMLLMKLRAFVRVGSRRKTLRAERLLDSLSGLYSIGSLLHRVEQITLDGSSA